jgi:hypothetical protein
LEATGQLHAPAALPLGIDTHWIGWVGARTVLDYGKMRKTLPLPELELRPLGRPARSQSLYRVSDVGLKHYAALLASAQLGHLQGAFQHCIDTDSAAFMN